MPADGPFASNGGEIGHSREVHEIMDSDIIGKTIEEWMALFAAGCPNFVEKQRQGVGIKGFLPN